MKSPASRYMMAAIISALLSSTLFADENKAKDKNPKNNDAIAAAANAVANDNANDDAKAVDPSYVFRMSNNKFIQGVPVDLPQIDVYILGTKVPIPMDAIVGIRFAATDKGKASIALKNGEVYNGTVEMPEVRLAVEWGEAKIKRGMLRSMVKTNDLFWQLKDTPAGSQWFLAPKNGSYQSSRLTTPSTRKSMVKGPMTDEPFASIWN